MVSYIMIVSRQFIECCICRSSIKYVVNFLTKKRVITLLAICDMKCHSKEILE